MYSLPRDKLLTNCPDYSRLVPGTPGYSYTKSKYFRPYVNCGRTRDIYCDRVCRNLCNESSTNYAESTNYETTYRAGAVEDYRQDEFQNCRTGTSGPPGTVTGKIQEILQHYGADQLKCDDLLYRYKISGCASSNSGRSIPGKAVRFASEIEQIGSQLGGEIGNQLGGHIGSQVGPSKLRSAEVMDAKERY